MEQVTCVQSCADTHNCETAMMGGGIWVDSKITNKDEAIIR